MYLTVKEMERLSYIQGNPVNEQLLSLAAKAEDMPTSMGDISAGFPGEDFLDDVILDLDCIIEQMHGNSKALPALKELAEKLRNVTDETRKNAEYGMHELNNLRERLGL